MAEKLYNAILTPPKDQPQTFEDVDGNERPLLRNVTLSAESKVAAEEILTEREAKQEHPYHVSEIKEV